MAFQKIENPKQVFGNFFFRSINCLAAWKNPENDTPGRGFLGGLTGKTSKMIPWKLTFFFDPLIVWALRKPENPECVVGIFFSIY